MTSYASGNIRPLPKLGPFMSLVNQVLFPLKLLIPQPLIKRIPGLTTNEDIRFAAILSAVRGRLLDVGCGPNRMANLYRSAGGDGIGVDTYPWEGVDMHIQDSTRMDFPGASFDTITFVGSFNHVVKREETLAEARRILRPDGRVALTMLTPTISLAWHKFAWWDRDQHERGMKEGEEWGFSEANLLDIFGKAGLELEEKRKFSWGLNRLYIFRKRK
jgi:SAM-dependent methyltransferase